MRWPSAHTCHNHHWPTPSNQTWIPPEVTVGGHPCSTPHYRHQSTPEPGVSRPYRSCSYCGCIHPEDAYQQLHNHGCSIEVARQKYGWPHKFYLRISNPLAGQQVCVGYKPQLAADMSVVRDRAGMVATDPVWHEAPGLIQAKFYSEHLLDEGYDNEARDLLIEEIWLRTGIKFSVTSAGKLLYQQHTAT